MSYPNGTILRRINPFIEPERLHLNHVKVTGKSPVQQPSLAEWGGATGDSVVIQSVDDLGSPASLPIVIGNAEYEVEYMPEPVPLVTHTEQVTQSVQRLRAETPEQQFARQDREIAAQAAAATPSPPVVEAAVEPEVVVEAAVPAKPAPKKAAKA